MNRNRFMSAGTVPETFPAAKVTTFRLGSVPAAIAEDMPLSGTPTAGKIAAQHCGGKVRTTVLTLNAVPVAVTDASAYANIQVYDFPKGRIQILGVIGSLYWAVTTARTTINDSASLTWALGTVVASNITLATTMIDLAAKATKVLAAATTALNTISETALSASVQFDGSGTAKDMFLNVGFETNTDIDGDGTLTATGTITITWVDLGDTVA